jgi:hypothetical protein
VRPRLHNARARGPVGQHLGLVLIGHTELPELTGDIRLQAEGLAFDSKGDLFIIGEGRTSLLHLHRQ